MRCDFCDSRMVRWRYPAGGEWLACERCHAEIQRDDREALLERVMHRRVPRAQPDRYAPELRLRARRLHEQFWQARRGPPRPA